MPITVPDSLPAKAILDKENIFIMDESRAVCQDIRALKIGILNLMPIKQVTEVQIIRLLANTPLQIELTLVACASHQPKNTSMEHLVSFYRCFEDIKDKKFDGFIITGAPVELLEYEQVTYWQELTEIMKWSTTNVTSTLHICWGALAGLYYHYNIPKYQLQEKVFGIFPHRTDLSTSNLLRGFDDMFYAPHSRYSEIKAADILKHKNLQILSTSQEAGVYIVESNDKKQVFVTGHSEYEPDTLKDEYERDLKKGLSIEKPRYYFNNDHPANGTTVMWRSHANLLFSNWVNYYVYQETPYML